LLPHRPESTFSCTLADRRLRYHPAL